MSKKSGQSLNGGCEIGPYYWTYTLEGCSGQDGQCMRTHQPLQPLKSNQVTSLSQECSENPGLGVYFDS